MLKFACAIHLNAWTHGNVGLLSYALSEEYYKRKEDFTFTLITCPL